MLASVIAELKKAENLNENLAFKFIVRDKLGDKIILVRRLTDYEKRIGKFEVLVVSFS
ncbi:MAG TPA: hypothetical protein PK728_00745 [Bacillota bacterium]|nr:hypothetical protein [Bacillota bacterium]